MSFVSDNFRPVLAYSKRLKAERRPIDLAGFLYGASKPCV